MKRPLAVIGLVLALAFPASAVPTGRTHGTHHSSSSSTKPKVYVKGYYRKDGTYVQGYDRSAPGAAAGTGATSEKTGRTGSSCPSCPRDAHGRIKRSEKAKGDFMRQTGYPSGRPGYVVDHIIPLSKGGKDVPSNMQWQTTAEARAKDRVERK